MIALGMGGCRCSPISISLPGNHTFANMNATVVYNAGFKNLISIGF